MVCVLIKDGRVSAAAEEWVGVTNAFAGKGEMLPMANAANGTANFFMMMLVV